MPNYTQNVLIITGDNVQLNDLKTKLGISTVGDSIENFFELFIKNDGSPSVDRNVDNWGTKWDVCDCEVVSLYPLKLHFQTAWSPPIKFFKTFAKDFYPTLTFELAYCEIGMGFYGMIRLTGEHTICKLEGKIHEFITCNDDDDSYDSDDGVNSSVYNKYVSDPNYLYIDGYNWFLYGHFRKFYEEYSLPSLGG